MEVRGSERETASQNRVWGTRHCAYRHLQCIDRMAEPCLEQRVIRVSGVRLLDGLVGVVCLGGVVQTANIRAEPDGQLRL